VNDRKLVNCRGEIAWASFDLSLLSFKEIIGRSVAPK
jgi:hypothetical protein